MALNAVCIQVYLEMFERHVHMKWILIIKLLENQNIYDFKKCKKKHLFTIMHVRPATNLTYKLSESGCAAGKAVIK